MFQPNQFIKCPYTSKPLRIVSVDSLQSNDNPDYKDWFNLHIIDPEGNTDIILHTPNNPMQIMERMNQFEN